ncbi:unnamed protein product [Caenorhabditis auriculariae]|uniref:YitH/HolE acetyltransferase (GNAT) domain-containing protein n=1 Tax=Caenorhabditis auriculariae TaxID=2777116 RepID=A0A8S1HTU0_9PELO|nr:unnamed protein product [Caenorhabditis auriculariae]
MAPLTVQAKSSGIKIIVNPGRKYWEQMERWYSETERWNMRPDEISVWASTYEKYWMFAGVDQETNEFVCSLSLGMQTTSDGEPLYSIGLFYCVPQKRGLGYGKPLFDAAMAHIGQSNATLYSAKEMSAWYASKHGFNKLLSFWTCWAEVQPLNLVLPEVSKQYDIKTTEEVDWDEIHDYDSTICCVEREDYLEESLTWEATVSRVAVDSNGDVVGFGSLRFVSQNEIYACPLYADNSTIARDLLISMLSTVTDLSSYSAFSLLFPEHNKSVLSIISELSKGRYKHYPIYRNQYLKKVLPVPWDKVYANDDVNHSIV